MNGIDALPFVIHPVKIFNDVTGEKDTFQVGHPVETGDITIYPRSFFARVFFF